MINKIHIGNALDVLKQMPDELVDCVVTSPPYWGLRDYGTEPQIWDGKGECEHEWSISQHRRERHPEDVKNLDSKQATNRGANCELASQQFCLHCSTWRGSLGLEPTPELYVQHIVQVFREVKRVLKKEGTLWLNLGDSYCNGGRGKDEKYGKGRDEDSMPVRFIKPSNGLKPKDVVGIPWRVAFALQADGWWLRSDIIWNKPNPMPESVTDRPTKAHEYIFLLTKSQHYYFDQDAVREGISNNTHNQISMNEIDRIKKARKMGANTSIGKGKTPKSVMPDGMIKQNDSFTNAVCLPVSSRNIRSVWTIATQPFKGAHFATFPEAIPERCIKGGCPEGGIVLDPFIGSGTVAKVAIRLRRNWIGIDLNPKYQEMAEKRKAWTQVEAY